MRRKHGQRELDRIRQLHRNHRIGRQAGFDEVGGERRDRLVGLHKGQPLWRLAGDALLVGRIYERQRIRLPREDAPEQDIEGRRCVGVGHGVGCVTLVA